MQDQQSLTAQAQHTHHERVRVALGVLAVGADVKIGALIAVPARARLDLDVAGVAAAGKGGHVGVVDVVQDHHGGVLGAPQGVELEVVVLAEVEEGLQGGRGGWGHGGWKKLLTEGKDKEAC